jgi:hypothetical protein
VPLGEGAGQHTLRVPVSSQRVLIEPYDNTIIISPFPGVVAYSGVTAVILEAAGIPTTSDPDDLGKAYVAAELVSEPLAKGGSRLCELPDTSRLVAHIRAPRFDKQLSLLPRSFQFSERTSHIIVKSHYVPAPPPPDSHHPAGHSPEASGGPVDPPPPGQGDRSNTAVAGPTNTMDVDADPLSGVAAGSTDTSTQSGQPPLQPGTMHTLGGLVGSPPSGQGDGSNTVVAGPTNTMDIDADPHRSGGPLPQQPDTRHAEDPRPQAGSTPQQQHQHQHQQGGVA